MNKLLLDKDYYHFKDEELNIIITKKNITIEIDGNVKINDLESKEDINLNIKVNDNSSLIYNKYNKNLSNSNIIIDVNNNTNVRFNQSAYNELEGNFKVNANILGSNNNTTINFYGVTNQKGKMIVDATGDVKKNLKNNDMLENVRILALNEEQNIILPNLLVSSNEVVINHNATLSSLNEDYLFYLESKGLTKEDASNLIYRGFLTSKLEIDDETKNNLLD
jgi:Fe-S cluster assembly protein SufD